MEPLPFKTAPGTQFTTQFTCFHSTKVQILTPEELVLLQEGGPLGSKPLSMHLLESLKVMLRQRRRRQE
jgi:hypothetical protein